MPRHDEDGRMAPVDVGVDRKRELRWLISRLYRVGALDERGGYRLSDHEFDAYLAAARDHIKPEHFTIFELTARAVRANAVDWLTAATRLAAYYAPETSGEKIVDFILDVAPIAGQVKAAKELVEAVQDAIDARAFGDQRAFDGAIAKASAAVAALALPGAAAGVSKLLKRELHHLIPLYLGGAKDGPTMELSWMVHRLLLHPQMQAYFRKVERGLAHAPRHGREQIIDEFSKGLRLRRLNDFYRTLERSRWPALREAEEWKRIFPEAGRFIE